MIMIIQIFIPERQAQNPLRQHVRQVVTGSLRGTSVMKTSRHAGKQLQPPRTLPQQQDPGIGGHLAAIERRQNLPFADP